MMISEYIGGTTEEFVNMMNKKAKELGIEIITEEQFLKWMNTGVR